MRQEQENLRHNDQIDWKSGKYFQRLQRGLSQGTLDRLERENDLQGICERDMENEIRLQVAEQQSNDLNSILLNKSSCRKLSTDLETDLEHGYNHTRRVEKWYKAINENSEGLRNFPHYTDFALSAFWAIRAHDMVEVFKSPFKESHDVASALLSLGYLLQNPLSRPPGIPAAEWDWEKIAWGAAFICYHHSLPEKSIPSVEILLEQGILNPREMLLAINKIAAGRGETIYSYFPPYQTMSRTIKRINNRTLKAPKFTVEEIKGLIKQAKAVSAADKLDSTYPAGLAATRTVLANQKRRWYTRIPGQREDDGGLVQELDYRIADGGQQHSQCDYNRTLFEITRTDTYRDLSPWLNYVYSWGLEERGRYFTDVIPSFLGGEFQPFLAVYNRLEGNEALGFLKKAGVPTDRATFVTSLSEEEDRHESIRALLVEKSIKKEALDAILYTIHGDSYAVSQALKEKYKKLEELGLSANEKKRILSLLDLAIKRQKANLLSFPGPIAGVKLPYDSYYWQDVEKWRIKET